MNRMFIALILVVAATGCGSPDAGKPNTAEAGHAKSDAHEEGEAGHAEGEESHAAGEAGHEEGGHGHDEAAEGELDIDADRIARAGIQTEAAGPAEIRQTLSLYGTVTADPARTRDVTARFPGLVKSVRVNLGDRVAAGATLATVESNDSLQVYPVTAPLAGIVTARNTNPGENAGDAPMFTITDLSSVTAELSAFPADRVKLRPGQPVRIVTSEGELNADGKIALIAPVGSSDNQSVAVRVPLANRDGRWATGLFVTGEVAIATSKSALTIPQSALQDIEGKPSVFVKNEHGFRTQPVKTGRGDGIRVELLEGLAAGDVVATDNSFALKAELGKGAAEHEH
ncbi:MAG: efflux RND transporter periplasmic adaptor subunit [Pseudomonadota bacterium]